MHAFLSTLLVTLTALFIVVDPIPVAPMFAAMTAGKPRDEIRRIALRGSVAGALLLVFFAAFGKLLFKTLHLDIGAFRAAGGLLLLLTAVDMLRGKVSQCRCSPGEMKDAERKHDISIVPLATPLLAGPGAIATVVMLSAEQQGVIGSLPLYIAIAVTFTVSYYVLRLGPIVQRLFGTSGMAMFERVMGLLLAAVGIQFMAEGARRLFNL